MIKVAISGNIASGKSTVEEIIRNKGYLVFDTDKITHKLLEKFNNEIVTAFIGFDISVDGKISRRKLGNLIFSDKKLKEKLEKILHPKIKNEIYNIFEKNKKEKMIFVSIPLLFEVNWQNVFDKILFIDADENIRLKRLMKRDNLSVEQAELRIRSQMSAKEKIKESDFIICNNGDGTNLQKSMDEIIILLEDSIGEIK